MCRDEFEFARVRLDAVARLFITSSHLGTIAVCSAASLLFGLSPAFAESISISCSVENANVSLEGGSLTATYEGEATGTVKIKASSFEFSVPAKKIKREADGAPVIQAYSKATAVMPDLAALEACIKKMVDPAEAGDNGAYDFAATQCTRDLKPGTAPVPIMAAVNILLVPGEAPGKLAPVVEVSRYYEGKTARPGGPARLDTFPGKCELER